MNRFDRAAEWVAGHVAHAWFFSVCLAFVIGWLAAGPVVGWSNETWHLALNSPTTSITFLLVALLHNTQERFERRTDERLERLLAELDVDDPCAGESKTALQ